MFDVFYSLFLKNADQSLYKSRPDKINHCHKTSNEFKNKTETYQRLLKKEADKRWEKRKKNY